MLKVLSEIKYGSHWKHDWKTGALSLIQVLGVTQSPKATASVWPEKPSCRSCQATTLTTPPVIPLLASLFPLFSSLVMRVFFPGEKKNLSKSPWSFYGFWKAEYTLRLFVHMLITEWHIEKKLRFNSSFWDPLFGFGIEWDPSVVHEVYNVKADPSWSSCYTIYPWKGLYWHRIWVSVTHAQDQRINVSGEK